VWLLHIGSWGLALWLFYTGVFLPGVGAASVSAVMWILYFFFFMANDPDYLKRLREGAEEGKKKAREDAYIAERIRQGLDKP
jgi:hypothetical protein